MPSGCLAFDLGDGKDVERFFCYSLQKGAAVRKHGVLLERQLPFRTEPVEGQRYWRGLD